MPKQRKKERVVCQHFVWLLGERTGVYYADGRANTPKVGRHSLNTRDRSQALEELKRLDVEMAVQHGLVNRVSPDAQGPAPLGLEEGRLLYEAHVGRPRVTGGASKGTSKRYRAVLDKFIKFTRREGISSWNRVSESVLERYAAHLDGEGYEYATEYLELTTLKQVVKWLVGAKHLPASCIIKLSLSKPTGTDTYCWRPEEVQALVEFCRTRQELNWLGNILVALACTGLRISELASLRWSDVDWNKNVIVLTDESTSARRGRRTIREIKNRRSRAFPIHDDLHSILKVMPRTSDGLVFHGPRGGKVKPDTIRAILVREVISKLAERFPTAAGEKGFQDGRLHSFRHFFCSTCANSGVAEQVVMQWLGHQHSAMVKHYYHLHNEEAQRQMKKLKFVDVADGTDAAG